MSTTTSCGQCGAPMRPEQAWCSLCFAASVTDVDPLTAPLEQLVGHDHASADEPAGTTDEEWGFDLADPATEAGRPAEVVGDVGLERPTEQRPRGQRPTGQRPTGQGSGTRQEVPEQDVDVMLSLLAAEHRQADPASGLLRVFDDRSARIMVMVGGTVVFAGLGFLVLTILGAVL